MTRAARLTETLINDEDVIQKYHDDADDGDGSDGPEGGLDDLLSFGSDSINDDSISTISESAAGGRLTTNPSEDDGCMQRKFAGVPKSEFGSVRSEMEMTMPRTDVPTPEEKPTGAYRSKVSPATSTGLNNYNGSATHGMGRSNMAANVTNGTSMSIRSDIASLRDKFASHNETFHVGGDMRLPPTHFGGSNVAFALPTPSPSTANGNHATMDHQICSLQQTVQHLKEQNAALHSQCRSDSEELEHQHLAKAEAEEYALFLRSQLDSLTKQSYQQQHKYLRHDNNTIRQLSPDRSESLSLEHLRGSILQQTKIQLRTAFGHISELQGKLNDALSDQATSSRTHAIEVQSLRRELRRLTVELSSCNTVIANKANELQFYKESNNTSALAKKELSMNLEHTNEACEYLKIQVQHLETKWKSETEKLTWTEMQNGDLLAKLKTTEQQLSNLRRELVTVEQERDALRKSLIEAQRNHQEAVSGNSSFSVKKTRVSEVPPVYRDSQGQENKSNTENLLFDTTSDMNGEAPKQKEKDEKEKMAKNIHGMGGNEAYGPENLLAGTANNDKMICHDKLQHSPISDEFRFDSTLGELADSNSANKLSSFKLPSATLTFQAPARVTQRTNENEKTATMDNALVETARLKQSLASIQYRNKCLENENLKVVERAIEAQKALATANADASTCHETKRLVEQELIAVREEKNVIALRCEQLSSELSVANNEQLTACNRLSEARNILNSLQSNRDELEDSKRSAERELDLLKSKVSNIVREKSALEILVAKLNDKIISLEVEPRAISVINGNVESDLVVQADCCVQTEDDKAVTFDAKSSQTSIPLQFADFSSQVQVAELDASHRHTQTDSPRTVVQGIQVTGGQQRMLSKDTQTDYCDGSTALTQGQYSSENEISRRIADLELKVNGNRKTAVLEVNTPSGSHLINEKKNDSLPTTKPTDCLPHEIMVVAVADQSARDDYPLQEMEQNLPKPNEELNRHIDYQKLRVVSEKKSTDVLVSPLSCTGKTPFSNTDMATLLLTKPTPDALNNPVTKVLNPILAVDENTLRKGRSSKERSGLDNGSAVLHPTGVAAKSNKKKIKREYEKKLSALRRSFENDLQKLTTKGKSVMVQKKNRRLCPERRINDDDFDFGDNNKLEQLRKDYRNNIASLRRTIDPSNGGNYVTEITPRSLTARKTESLSVNRNLIELETLVSRVGDNRHSSPAIMNDSIISSRDCQPYLLNSNLVSLDCSDDAVDSSFGACWGTSNSTRKTPYIRRSNETAVESTEAFVLNVLNFCDGI